MTPPRRHRPKFAVLTASIAAVLTSLAPAAVYTWDGNGTTAPNPDGGPGTWDINTSLNWWSGTTNVVWPILGGTDDDAVFANNAGIVSLAVGGITANDLTFNTTGYVIQSDALTLNGTTPTITTSPGVTATISSVVAGAAGLTKAGTGTLILSGVNTYTNNTTIGANGGTLQIGGAGSLGSGTYAGTVAIGSGGKFQYSSSATQTLSGAISGLGGLIKDSNASVLTLSSTGTNYTGATMVSAGTLKLVNTTAFASATTVQAGATLQLANTANNSIGAAGSTITLNSAALTHTGTGYQTLAGPFTSTGTSSIAVTNNGASNQLFFDGGINGSGTINVTNTGTATTGVAFRNAGGSFAGAVNIFGGQIAVGNNATPLINADLTLDSAATLHLGAAAFGLTATGTSIKSLNGTGTATSAGSATTLTLGSNSGTGSFSGTLLNGAGGTLSLTKVGSGTQTLSGIHSFTGATSVNGGTLSLDYTTNNASKLSDTAALNLGGGTLNVIGDHNELVLATSLTANTASAVTRTSGAGVMQLNAITRNPGATINFGAASIATTDTLNNTGGMLGVWATVGGTDWAVNSTNAPDGPITAYAAYTDVTRLSSGTKVIANTSTNDVRIIEGTGSVANLTLGAATTTINTLNQSAAGGTGAATIDPAGQTLAVNAILAGSGAGGLTVGTGTNNGTLTAGTAGGELVLNNQSSNGLTIHSVVANNSSASTLTASGPGTIILDGINTYTGATAIAGILQIGGAGTLGSSNYAGAISLGTGGTLQYNSSAAQTLSGIISGAGVLSKSGTGTLTFAGANSFTGGSTVNSGTLKVNTSSYAKDGSGRSVLGSFTVNAGGILELNATGTANNYAGGQCVILQTGSNFSGAGTINKTGGGVLDIWVGSSLTGFIGQMNVQAGTLANQENFHSGLMSVDISSGAYLDLRTNSLQINKLTGTGTIGGSFSAGMILTVGSNNEAATFGGVIQNTVPGFANAPTIGLTKIGTATQTLSGANTYTGATTVSNGGLILNAASLSTGGTVSVAGPATFGGKGSAGAVSVTGGTIQGGVADVGSLSLTSLTFSGNSLLNLTPVAGPTASVAVSGAVTTSGTQTLNIVKNAPLAPGAYRLVSFGSLGGSGMGAFVLGTTPPPLAGARSRSYALDTTTAPGAYVGLNVVGDAPIWSGNTSGAWDTTTANNWVLASDGTTPTTYFAVSDAVQFNNTPGNRNVTISGTDVMPGSVVFNNDASHDYTLSGPNAMAGSSSLTKAGAGKLTITNTNTYTGGTLVTGGTLELGNGTTNGVIAGDIANTANVTFRNATAQTFSGVISGSGGTLIKAGPGALTLSGANTYTGATTISAGTLVLNSNSAADSAGYTLGDANTGGNNVVLAIGAGFTTANTALPNVGSRRLINVTVSNLGTGTTTIDASAAVNRADLVLTMNRGTILKGGSIGGNTQVFTSISGTGTAAGTDAFTLDTAGNVGTLFWSSNQPGTAGNVANSFTGNVHFTNSGAGTGLVGLQNLSYVANTAINQNLQIPDTSSVTVDGNVTLSVHWGAETIDALNGSGRVETSNTPLLAGTPLLTVGAGNGNGTFSGILQNGGGTFSFGKTGAGTQILSGANTYTGATTVSSGALLLNGGSLNTVSAVSVAGPATFGGKGGAGAVSVTGGTIQGGVADTGSLSLTSLTFNGNSVLNLMPVGGPTPTASVAVSGNVTTSGTQTLNITNSTALAVGNYLLLSYATIDGAGIDAFKLGSTPPTPPSFRPRTYALDTTTLPFAYVGLTVSGDAPIWTGSTNGRWNTTTSNWVLASDGTTPTTYFSGDAVQFNDLPAPQTIIISGADVSPGSVTFNNSFSTDYTLTGPNGITGTTTLNLLGLGTVIIANTNTYTGDTNVSSGSLQLGDGTTNGVIAGNIVSTANVNFVCATAQTYSGNLTGAFGTLTKSGPGTLTLTGANSYNGGAVINQGILQIGNGIVNGTIGISPYTISTGATLYLNYATATGASWANMSGSGKLELNSAQPVNGSANWNLTPMSLGAGFTGTLQVDKGRVSGAPGNFGGTTNIILGDGAQFLAFDGSIAGTAYTYGQDFSIAGFGWGEAGLNLGALRVSGMDATFSGHLTLTAPAGLMTQSNATSTMTVSGPITDGGSGYALTLNATGNTITLSNPGNSYGGDTNVALGTTKLGASEVLPDGPGKGNVTVASTLDLNGFSETVNGLSGAGTIDTVAGGTPTLTVGNNNATSTFSGVIKNTLGALSLTKIGNGILTLSGVNPYSGTTTVSAGTLLVSGSISGSVVTVNGGTLGGSGGLVGDTTVNSGGTLAPGSSIGTLNFTSLTLGGTSSFEINKTGSTLTSDLANVTGALTLGGILNVTASGNPLTPGDTFNLFDAGTFSGSFTTLNLPTLSDINYSWDTSNLGTAGTLTVVPEPGAAVALLSGLGLLLGLRRRRV